MDCLATETVLALAEGRLTDAETAAVDEHLDSCAGCRQLVRAAVQTEGGAPSPPRTPVALERGNAVGRYLILDVLGSGAMGVVYAAYDPELDRKVALKLIRPEHAGELGAARLLREGRAFARLAHPNVVSVFDLGKHEGGVFVAMELVDGASLAGWLAEKPRAWPEILGVFLQAGAGLAAAHAAGLVHRDFKPANVLVGRDGRVRVGDFGLARHEGERPTTPPPGDAPVDITQTGALVGTPAYMAPEQFEGVVDAASDQFSFAVSLWEALYGARPFRGANVNALIADIASSRPSAPARSDVPARIRDALLRALSPAPRDRFESLAPLLAAIAPRTKRRSRWLIAAALAAVVLAAVGGSRYAHSRDVCGGADDELRGVWDVPQRLALVRAFGNVGKPYASSALGAVENGLDGYARDWVAMKTESCRATAVRHVQTEEHQGLRDVCLAERLLDMRAFVSVLAQADSEVVARAPQAVAQLPAIDACADVRSLAQATPPPSAPQARMRGAAVEGELAAADALGSAGKYVRAYAIAKRAARDAREIGDHGRAARSLALAGQMANLTNEQHAAADLLAEAIDEAELARDDRTVAFAWVALVVVVGAAENRYEEGLAIARHASAAVDRAGGEPHLRARLELYRGHVFVRHNQLKDGLAAYQAAEAIVERTPPYDELTLATILDHLGTIYDRMDRFDEAATAFQRVVEIRERLLGPEHPDLASAYDDIGATRERRSDAVGAAAAYRRSIAIAEAAFGPDAGPVAHGLFNLARVSNDDPKTQEQLLVRAAQIFDRIHDLSSTIMSRKFLAFEYSTQRAFDRANRELDLAAAAAAQPDGPELDDAYWITRSEIYYEQHQGALAEHAAREALAYGERVYGPDAVNTGLAHAALGLSYEAQGKYEQAAQEARRDLELEQKHYPSDDSNLAVPMKNLGMALYGLGQTEAALREFDRSIALYEAAFDKRYPDLVDPLNGRAIALERLGRHAEAADAAEQAIALDHVEATDPYRFHQAQLLLAISSWNAGRDRARARQLASEARAGLASLSAPKELAEADRWLAEHR